MFFKVQDLEIKPIPFSVDYPIGSLDLQTKSWRQASPLHAEGVAELASEMLSEVRVRGTVSVRFEGECDRCLEAAVHQLNQPFRLLYRPLSSAPESDEVEIAGEEAEIGFFEGAGLNLADVVQETVLLELPMHSLCQPDCLGICPQCGINRNSTDCDCAETKVDDRWEALKALSVKPTE